MRVISGEFKGIPLKAVPGQTTRPTTDKVKESIFNMIGPYFNGGIMLDLFAGSGAIAIESISRGMEKAYCIDKDYKAIKTMEQNLAKVKISKGIVEVYRNDANRALQLLNKKEIVFDFIFLDPPYGNQALEENLEYIEFHKLLSPGGLIVCEHDKRVDLNYTSEEIKLSRNEVYGDTKISIFRNEAME